MRKDNYVQRIGSVLKLEYGKPLPEADRDPNGRYAAYGANGVKCRTNKTLFNRRSIIVGRKGSAGEVTLTEGPFWPLDVTYYVTFDESRHDLIYIYHCLKFLDLPRLANGVKPGINRNAVYEIEFWFPPLAEQKRIVAILDAAFEGIDTAIANTEQNLANARALAEAELDALVQSTDGDLTTLGGCCQRITVGHVGSMARRYSSAGVTFLRSQNVRPFEINLTDVKFIDEQFHSELRKSELKPGDVAIVRTGYPGTAAVIPEELGVANCADLVIATPSPSLLPEFLAMLLNSRFGKTMISGKLTGAAQKHFNVSAARKVMFRLPPVDRQKAAFARYEEVAGYCSQLESSYVSKQTRLCALKQSILQSAFVGKLGADSMMAETGVMAAEAAE